MAVKTTTRHRDRTYRIFTRNPDGKYSAFCNFRAKNARIAVKRSPVTEEWKVIPGMVRALMWPPTPNGERWLKANLIRG